MNSNSILRWLIVVGGFISYFLADGCTYSAGILFSEFKDVFQHNSVATSVIPALIYAMPQFMSPILCPITDLIGYSTAAAWGAFFLCLSFMVTSFAQDVGLTYFSYGIIMALGLQLTYTSALMAVVSTFKDNKFFGLACGIMVCGGGIGAFATNHLIAWILSSWTWRETLMIQGAIFLHAWISAAIFYTVDERNIEDKENKKFLDYISSNKFNNAEIESVVTGFSESNVSTVETQISTHEIISKGSRFILGVKKYWFLCPIIMILAPSGQRPRAQKDNTCAPLTPSHMPTFCQKLGASMSQLLSKKVWKNGRFLVYVMANGLCAAGVVIPWTFAYDLVRQIWLKGVNEEEVDSEVETQLAWFPSLIGLGSCFGQILFGILISKVNRPRTESVAESVASRSISIRSGDVQQSASLSLPVQRRASYSISRLTFIFAFVMLLNGVTTLGFTYVSIPSAVDISLATGEKPGLILILSTTGGSLLAFACFAMGISDGAFMTLLGPILEESLDDKQFPAGLGICLCFTGLFNLAGTLIGGHMFDVFSSYTEACVLAAILPFTGFLLVIVFYCFMGGFKQVNMSDRLQGINEDI